MMPAERAVTGTREGDESHPGDEIPIPCFRCGICCTCYQAPLVPEDIESVALALGISNSEFISRYALRVPTREGYLLRKVDTGCVFLAREADERARCTIYQSRPKACREWQPGISRPACLEGLTRLKSKGQLAQLNGYFRSDSNKREFYVTLEKALGSTGPT